MKIGNKFLTISVLALLSVSPGLGEDLSAEWEEIFELDGIIGYIRARQETNINEIKAIGTVDATVPALEAVLRDDSARTEYAEGCTEAYRVVIPGFENTKDKFCAYHKIDMPWPIYDRDSVGRIEFMLDEKTGALRMQARAVSTDFTPDEYAVRVPIAWAKWELTPIGENKTEVLYQVLADPGGYLPAFLVNMFSQELAVYTIAGIRKIVKKDKYKNAKSIVTTTPWIR